MWISRLYAVIIVGLVDLGLVALDIEIVIGFKFVCFSKVSEL